MLLLMCPEDSHELGGFNPSFLWLLRDFYFDMIEEGRKVRPGMYSSQACTQLEQQQQQHPGLQAPPWHTERGGSTQHHRGLQRPLFTPCWAQHTAPAVGCQPAQHQQPPAVWPWGTTASHAALQGMTSLLALYALCGSSQMSHLCCPATRHGLQPLPHALSCTDNAGFTACWC